jgi:hypothetical protein
MFEEERCSMKWVVKVDKDGVSLVGIDGIAKPPTSPDTEKSTPLRQVSGLAIPSITSETPPKI